MNVLSLPDEMLANILKYSKFETIVRLRKINVKIDKVTVRYSINKPKTFNIRVNLIPNELTVSYKYDDLEEKCPSYPEHGMKSFNCSNITDNLKQKLEQVRNVKLLNIYRLDIDATWISLLQNVRQKSRTRLAFVKCSFKVSLDEMKQLFGKFQSVDLTMCTEKTLLGNNFASDTIIRFLLPCTRISLVTSKPMNYLEITDKTLKEIQRLLPNKFTVGWENITQFTIAEVVETMKVASRNLGKISKNWNLGKVKINTRDEMIQAAKAFKCIDGIQVSDFYNFIFIRLPDGNLGYTVYISTSSI